LRFPRCLNQATSRNAGAAGLITSGSGRLFYWLDCNGLLRWLFRHASAGACANLRAACSARYSMAGRLYVRILRASQGGLGLRFGALFFCVTGFPAACPCCMNLNCPSCLKTLVRVLIPFSAGNASTATACRRGLAAAFFVTVPAFAGPAGLCASFLVVIARARAWNCGVPGRDFCSLSI